MLVLFASNFFSLVSLVCGALLTMIQREVTRTFTKTSLGQNSSARREIRSQQAPPSPPCFQEKHVSFYQPRTGWSASGNKLIFSIYQGWLRLLYTKHHRKNQPVAHNSWCCTHLFNLVPIIPLLVHWFSLVLLARPLVL